MLVKFEIKMKKIYIFEKENNSVYTFVFSFDNIRDLQKSEYCLSDKQLNALMSYRKLILKKIKEKKQ